MRRVPALIAGALLAASVAARTLAVDRPAAPPELGDVPAFELTDEAGAAVTRQALAGAVWIADFIFTRCAGQCPLMSARMALLQERLRDVPAVQLISFTVDPDYDTPEVLTAYARRYRAAPGRWRFVTGGREAVWRLAREGFKLGIGEEGTAEEPITHSVRLALVDRRGRIRGYYDATDAQAMERLYHDTRLVLHEGEPAEPELELE
jgi:protein SCO1/2